MDDGTINLGDLSPSMVFFNECFREVSNVNKRTLYDLKYHERHKNICRLAGGLRSGNFLLSRRVCRVGEKSNRRMTIITASDPLMSINLISHSSECDFAPEPRER
jgi:hypothetical protein